MQDPAQLLEVFSQLEASNMFQIAAAQEAEAALEAARAAHAATQVGGPCGLGQPGRQGWSGLAMQAYWCLPNGQEAGQQATYPQMPHHTS